MKSGTEIDRTLKNDIKLLFMIYARKGKKEKQQNPIGAYNSTVLTRRPQRRPVAINPGTSARWSQADQK